MGSQRFHPLCFFFYQRIINRFFIILEIIGTIIIGGIMSSPEHCRTSLSQRPPPACLMFGYSFLPLFMFSTWSFSLQWLLQFQGCLCYIRCPSVMITLYMACPSIFILFSIRLLSLAPLYYSCSPSIRQLIYQSILVFIYPSIYIYLSIYVSISRSITRDTP